MPRYEVQTLFVDTFENCWSDENGLPLTFATKREAAQELREYLADVRAAVKAGDMVEGYSRADFRIAPVEESANA